MKNEESSLLRNLIASNPSIGEQEGHLSCKKFGHKVIDIGNAHKRDQKTLKRIKPAAKEPKMASLDSCARRKLNCCFQ